MTRPRQFDLICFDWDGTLSDSSATITHCIQQAALDLGCARPANAAAARVTGMPLAQALAAAVPGLPPEKFSELAARYWHHHLNYQHDISLFEGVLPLLAQLKARHHWLAVATGKSRRGLDGVLASRQLHGIFDGSRTADQTAGKPDPLMLHELMREFGVAAKRTLMIGDTTHDLQMALNAGCASVGVSYGAPAPDEFAALAPRHVAHSVADLRRWLEEFA